MTYSILAKDPLTGALGIAVASRFFAAGAMVPHMTSSIAVATQAFVNPLWGVEGAARLARGERAQTVLDDFVQRDEGRAQRQAHMMDTSGEIAVHTGDACVDWAGHRVANGVSVAGNMLAGPDVVDATLEAYVLHVDMPFEERLLKAMFAGEAVGGDKRGKQSAALRIHHGQDYPWLDIRADDHADPLGELDRLLDVSRERFLHFAKLMATRGNFSGASDRNEVDAAILRREKEVQEKGLSSRSHATE